MSPKCVILCVDDDEDDHEMLCSVMNDIFPAVRILHANDGLEALAYLSKAKKDEQLPNLILLDLNMPKMDGKETLRRIQEDKDLRKISTVIFTTSLSPIDKDFSARHGVEMVTKPAELKGLEKELIRLINNVQNY